MRYLWILIIIGASILAYSSSWNDSLTFDETPYIGAAYSYLTQRDMRLSIEHPPLYKDLAGIPLLFKEWNEDAFKSDSWLKDTNNHWEFANRFLFQSGNDTIGIARLARFPLLFFFIASAVLVFRWARKRYGQKAAFLALIIFCFSPTILAHSRLVTNDVAAMWGYLVATYFFLRFLRNPRYKETIWFRIFLGLALITKFSTLILLPLFLILAFIFTIFNPGGTKKIIAKLILSYIISIVVIIYPVYSFHISNYPADKQRLDTIALVAERAPWSELIIWASDKSFLRPLAHYGLGATMNLARIEGGNNYYFLGEVGNQAKASYFPIVYLIKEPLPWLILLFVAIAWFMRNQFLSLIRRFRFYVQNNIEEITIFFIAIIYFVLSIIGNLNLGIRYLLPIYPFVILLVSRAVTSIQWKKPFSAILLLLVAWYVVESVFAFPNYLSYFNQSVGGSKNGHGYVTDSNTDWGQDLIRLNHWLDENKIEKIEGDLFTSTDPKYYLAGKLNEITRDKYRSEDQFIRTSATPWLAVSYSQLEDSWASNTGYSWLEDKRPEKVIGHSIAVYKLY